MQSFAEVEKAGWAETSTAQAYATDFARAAAYAVPVLLDAVGAEAECKLLDLCCGQGSIAQEAHQRGADVIGMDFSEAMLDLARTRVPGVAFRAGDAMNLDIEDAAFDAIVIGFGIPHVPDPEQVFAEAARVLKPGGRLAYSVWQDRAGGLQYVFQAIAAHGQPGIALPPGPGAHDYADPERASRALAAAGFQDVAFTDVDSRWQVDDPAAPFTFFRDGTVRGGALLRAQPEANAEAIRAAVSEKVLAEHGTGPVWDIPIPSVVVSALKPVG